MKAIVGIGKDVEHRAEFKKWLREQGYDARLNSKSSFNGVDIRKDADAKEAWKNLWYEFEIYLDV